MDAITIELRPGHFGEAEAVLATYDGLTASTFRYPSGVLALRIANRAGHATLLPFQGQQVWDATFLGRPLTMRSMFTQPVDTMDYLSTYGGLFIHCGVTAMGGPGPADHHPLHGELPNARYQSAQLVAGRDDDGPFMALTGSYRHTVAFTHNYEARPTVTLHADATQLRVDLTVRNLRHAPMDLMYLAHINFRPVDDGVLIDTARRGRDHVRLRADLPAHVAPSPSYLALIETLRADPEEHRILRPGRVIDPELVMMLECRADAQGWAHSMQLHPDGTADFVSHRPDQLDHGVRWMSRTGDQDTLGLMLPATAESGGYTAEKAKGNVRTLPPLGRFDCSFSFGALARGAAAELRRRIEVVVG